MLCRVTFELNDDLNTVNGAEYSQKIISIKQNIHIEQTHHMSSLSWDNTFLNMASILGKQSHCVSKGVACLITKDSRIISTGINGTPAGLNNCDSLFKHDDFDRDLHHEFSHKYEIHAEINALLSAAKYGISLLGAKLYVNYSPCSECAKSIAASGIKEVCFRNFYTNDLGGFVFLFLCDNILISQVIESDTERNIFKKASEDAKKLTCIGDYIDRIHPFSKIKCDNYCQP